MLDGSIGNFASRVWATLPALARALRLGVPRAPRGTWRLFVVQLVGLALDGLILLLASSWSRAFQHGVLCLLWLGVQWRRAVGC